MSKICFGCGAKLQSSDEFALGYIPKEKLETSSYCKRCFRLIHYGEVGKGIEPKTVKEIVSSVNKNAKFVVFVVDFIDIYDEVLKIYKSISVPKILAISKSDIIPKNVSFSAIKESLRSTYRIREDIVFTSKKGNVNSLNKILYGKEEVYFLGLTNSGKSTLLNMLIDQSNAKVKKLTTSYKENTTQDFVRINLGNMTLVDSPGFVLPNYELEKSSNISNEIKPITYQNKTNCTYRIKKHFDLRITGNSNIVFYFSRDIALERLYDKSIIGMTFKVKGNSDIVFAGLGFVKTTDDIEITIPLDLMKYVNVRPSLVGGKHE